MVNMPARLKKNFFSVIFRNFCLIFVFLNSFCFALEEVNVTAEIEPDSAYENQPVTGIISITHQVNQRVDINDVHLGKNKLAVDLVKEVQFVPNNPIVLSIYQFHLPGQHQGLYALPSISVMVGGKRYESIMTSYTVREGSNKSKPSPGASQKNQPVENVVQASTNSSVKPNLRLEALIDGPSSLYPGEHTKFVYRYYFSGDIQLSTETLPMLDAQGMIKIGEKEIKDYTQNGLSIRDISQEVEAENTGNYTFGPSVIEGFAYQEDGSGKQIPIPPKLTSTAPPLTVTVRPFPENQPPSFRGAVGKYQIQTSVQGPTEVNIGDSISLVIEISGQGNLQNVLLPELSQQPGFSGFFKFNDLPPATTIEGITKTFIVILKPSTEDVKQIPRVEFTFFDPVPQKYGTVYSSAIPISVKALSTKISSPKPVQESTSKDSFEIPVEKSSLNVPPPSGDPAPIVYVPSPIEIEGIFPLSSSDLYNKVGGTWWVLAILPFGIGILFYLVQLRDYFERQQQQQKIVSSSEIFVRALKQPEGSSAYFDGLTQSLKQALFEAGLISTNIIENENLPTTGLCGEVKFFLNEIEKRRFTGQKPPDYVEIRTQALYLLRQIQKVRLSKLSLEADQ